MNGILNIYKESGMTSFAVVSRVRKFCGERRVGHAGTLDPMASGVLPILVGKAAVMQERLSDHDKRYIAGLKLGILTDTGDVTGNVLETKAFSVTTEQFCEILSKFCGKIMQVPPMYSAIQIDGQRLYDLARKGIEVERQAREIEIYENTLVERVNDTDFVIDVSCSKGTYIRTLCEDIAKALGTVGTMYSLERVQCGDYSKIESIKIGELEELYQSGRQEEIQKLLLPVEPLFGHLPKVRLPEFYTRLCLSGCEIYLKKLKLSDDAFEKTGGECSVYTFDGRFIGNAFVLDYPDGKAIKVKYRFL
ncbi:MAG: tRNA pseudouridine(55) synthase TruB [Clostridia bacterium]|nr:tRNA pseudouridine(55) synthase TruB [Clostridia bacterium]MBQ8759374.1 tRNA pseudouridine(55) synthase TruB [Clostridia bacterium]